MPLVLLRLEGAAVLVASVYLYGEFGRSWLLFALLLFIPDVGMLGYLVDTRIGTIAYDVFTPSSVRRR